MPDLGSDGHWSGTGGLRMQFGLLTAHDRTLTEARSIWRRAEELGFDALGVVDSPMLMREALVSLATLALDTSNVRIFPAVLNILTRDLSVVAGAYLGLRDLAGDRAFMCFGAGDSSTQGVGLGTARPQQMEEFVAALRALLKGGTAEVADRTLAGHWHGREEFEPRLYVSAHGPRALQMAGRVADGVISGFGVLPEHIAHVEDLVTSSAVAAGRDPASIEIWHRVHYCPAPTIDEGFLHANGGGASVLARGGFTGKLVPPELEDGITAVADTWSLGTHGGRANTRAVDVARETGTLDYLVARTGGLVGPANLVATIAELRNCGVKNLLFVAMGDDKRCLVEQLGGGLAEYRRLHEGVPS